MKILWHKSLSDRLFILFLWISVLIALNRQIYMWFDLPMMVILIMWGYILYTRIKLYKSTLYNFSEDKITIYNQNNKSYQLPLNDIVKITPVKNKQWLISKDMAKYRFWIKTIDYSTSLNHQFAIHMKDWLVILISPSKIEGKIKKIYPFKK